MATSPSKTINERKQDHEASIFSALVTFWALTESDVLTFVVPDTLYGILGALAGPVLTTAETPSFSAILPRFPLVAAYIWLNVVIFELANQRNSCAEDALNKPTRPIPSGRMTSKEMQQLLLASIPIVLGAAYWLDVWHETSLLIGMTWMYNDLGGGNDNFIIRNLIIAAAFGLYNLGALRIACGSQTGIEPQGYIWTGLVSAVIFSTMHIQDLVDQEGDKARGRTTAPLYFGDGAARWTIAVPVVAWSILCPAYLGVGLLGYVFTGISGVYIAVRTLRKRGRKEDRRSWELWAGWLISLYFLPLIKHHGL